MKWMATRPSLEHCGGPCSASRSLFCVGGSVYPPLAALPCANRRCIAIQDARSAGTSRALRRSRTAIAPPRHGPCSASGVSPQLSKPFCQAFDALPYSDATNRKGTLAIRSEGESLRVPGSVPVALALPQRFQQVSTVWPASLPVRSFAPVLLRRNVPHLSPAWPFLGAARSSKLLPVTTLSVMS